ncbi:MAG: methyltransferase, partial [Microbacterium sp.]|nr:methyltransferase [Microbacterium sp.]
MPGHDASDRFAHEAIVEPDPIARARTHALEIGADPISAPVGAQVAVLAAAA